MAKKKNHQQSAIPKASSAGAAARGKAITQSQKSSADGNADFFRRYSNYLLPAGIAIITWLFLQVCLDNQFTNWDDPGYVRDNPLIKDISAEGIANIFSLSNPIMGNYHPFTIFTYALEYSGHALQPWVYHRDSLLLHILTTLLSFWLALKLTKSQLAATITALLFGLHPMHIESVAWVAGRKDVVYGAFFMAACIAYLEYVKSSGLRKWMFYGAVLVMFVCSLLGKPVAVVLPVALLVFDYFEGRKISIGLLVEKLPLFALSIAFGIKSVIDQRAFGSLNTLNVSYNIPERIALGCYALVTYLWKAVAPAGLLCFYPYPEKPTGTLPVVFYVYPVIVAGLVFLAFRFLRKSKLIVFGLLFFLVNIALLLQFIPVGGAIVADRYSYIPYFGLFLIAGWGLSEIYKEGALKKYRFIATGIMGAYILTLGYLSNERCKVWFDTTSLWSDVIAKEPQRAPNAYNNLGFNYFNKFNESANQADRKRYYDSAYVLLNKSIELQPSFANPYISLGELERSVGQFNEAKRNYYKALSLNYPEEFANAYLGLGIIYAINHNFDSSGYCLRKAIELRPYFPEAHSNYGNFLDMTHNSDSALVQYGVAIAQNPDMYAPHLNRGRLLVRLKRIDEAMKDFNRGLELNPDNGEIYYARSYCYAQKGDRAQALRDIEKAHSLGFTQIDNSYYQAMKGR